MKQFSNFNSNSQKRPKRFLSLRGFRNFFKSLKTDRSAQVLFFEAKCSNCGEIIRVRVNMLTDLESMYTEPQDEGVAFRLRKEILGKDCRKLMLLEVDFDRDKKIISAKVEGGVLLSEKESNGKQ